ncbi:MAG: patatin-like phospholipase family protein [Saprospiraceae bacterium]
MKKYPFKNLVLKGGGIRGIAYLGALKVLYDKGVMPQIEKVAGSSAGAISALVVALNLTYEETVETANSFDFKQVPGTPSFFETRDVNDEEYYDEEAIPRGLLNTFRNLGASVNEIKFLFSALGMHTSEYAYNWFGDQVMRVAGKRDATFREFVDAGGKDLYITVTNISNQTSHICSAHTTPDLEVAEAVRTSMSIPIYFESIAFDNIYFKGYFGDGGVMNNYPINLFDEGLYANEDTLGFFLYEETKLQSFPTEYGLKRLTIDLINSLLCAQDWQVARQQEDIARSIQISTCGIGSTDFEIVTGDEKYQRLFESGKKGAEVYFKAYDDFDLDTLLKPKIMPGMMGFA